MSGHLPMRSPGVLWTAVGMFAVAWFCLDGLIIPPDFGQTDIYYFKDAGINLAEGLGLTTRFTYGNPTFAYRDYAHYPPLYPLVFGLFVKLAGVSARSNQAFNSLVAMAVGLVGFAALRPVISSAVASRYRASAEAGFAILSLVTGFYYFTNDRPDGLATAFGIGALVLAIRGSTARSGALAGALCALALFTSPFAGLWASLGTLAGMAVSAESTATQWHTVWLRRLGYIAIGGGGMMLALLGLVRLILPGWFDAFAGVASGANTHNETGGGYFIALLKGDFGTWWSGFSDVGTESYFPLLKLCAVAAALAAALMAMRRKGVRAAQELRLLALLIASPLCLITVPYQGNYLPISAALFLAAWASIEAANPAGIRRACAIAILAAFTANVALSVPFETRELLIRSTTKASLERALSFLKSHREILEPRTGYAAVSPSDYILWRQAGLHPVINIFSGLADQANRARVDILGLSFPGSGNPMLPQRPRFVPLEEYSLESTPALPQRATLMGRSLSNSSQTWESAIYVRQP